ncbi:hypothetical protein HDV63DRAFT_117694 [Trichoderma sp. SZMC 28014]
MRFSAATLVAALPALAAAQENPLDQYVAQFQQILGQVASKLPLPGSFDAAGAHEAKTGPMKLSVLSQDNWKETLYEPVAPESKTPEEWYVLFTGGNKTCFGHCGRIEAAFNETATKFAELPNTPHMALLNCDTQPVLCNAWSANPGNIWAIEMLPEPAPIDIYKTRLNLTTVTSDDIVKLHEAGNKDSFTLVDSWFHPFNGQAVELGLAIPLGYLMWFFGLLPNWAFMLIISFASRSFMGNRMQPGRQPGGASRGAPAAAPRK